MARRENIDQNSTNSVFERDLLEPNILRRTFLSLSLKFCRPTKHHKPLSTPMLILNIDIDSTENPVQTNLITLGPPPTRKYFILQDK